MSSPVVVVWVHTLFCSPFVYHVTHLSTMECSTTTTTTEPSPTEMKQCDQTASLSFREKIQFDSTPSTERRRESMHFSLEWLAISVSHFHPISPCRYIPHFLHLFRLIRKKSSIKTRFVAWRRECLDTTLFTYVCTPSVQFGHSCAPTCRHLSLQI